MQQAKQCFETIRSMNLRIDDAQRFAVQTAQSFEHILRAAKVKGEEKIRLQIVSELAGREILSTTTMPEAELVALNTALHQFPEEITRRAIEIRQEKDQARAGGAVHPREERNFAFGFDPDEPMG